MLGMTGSVGRWLVKSIRKRQRAPPPKLSVLFFVAIAIRKFQKFATNKFKESLKFYFDKRVALDELEALHKADRMFFIKEFVKVSYFIRKFDLTLDDLTGRLPGIVDDMYGYLEESLTRRRRRGDGDYCDAPAEHEKRIQFLCSCFKYLARNSPAASFVAPHLLQFSAVADLLIASASSAGENNNDNINNNDRATNDALVTCLAYVLEKSNDIRSHKLSELETLILNLPELGEEAKSLFLSKLESGKVVVAGNNKNHQQQTGPRSSMNPRKVKKNQQVVSRTIQTVKSKQETKKSEEADLKLMNLSDCMRNRNRKLKCNTVLEKLESTNDESGNDQSVFRTTWAETINLFSLVSQGHVLKKDDKDTYLPDKFLGYHYFTGTFWNSKVGDGNASKLYSFFINRMCASIFEKVSRKQQLNDAAVDKLFKCLTPFDSLVTRLDFEKDFAKRIVDAVFDRYWDLKTLTSPDIVASLFKEIASRTTEEYLSVGWVYNTTEVRRKSYSNEDVEKLVADQVNLVRVDALKALVNCAVRDKKRVLTKERVEIINAYTKLDKETRYPNAKFEDSVFKLIEVANTLDDFNYADTFQNFLTRLPKESRDNVKPILSFVKSQARDSKRSKELFTHDVMEQLVQLLDNANNELTEAQKLDVVDIINTCLQHEEHTNALSTGNLEHLLQIAMQGDEYEDGIDTPYLLNSALTSLLLSTDKTHESLSPSVVNLLLSNFDRLSHDEECTSYMVFILSRVFCSDNNEKKTKNASSFIKNEHFVESLSTKMLCHHVGELNEEDGQPILFVNALSGNKTQSGLAAGSSSSSSSSSNQISLLAAKMVFRSIENQVAVTPVTIDNLLLVLEDNNISSSDHHHQQENKKQTKILAAKSIYHLTNLMLGQHDYEPEINESLFAVVLHACRKQQELTDKDLFALFNGILALNGKYAPQVLEILVAYTFKYTVPGPTVAVLENSLSIPSHFEEALVVLQNIILSGESCVTGKTLCVFLDYLWLSSNSHLRVYAFKLLEQASKNQDLDDGIFTKLELVRAGYALEKMSHHGQQQQHKPSSSSSSKSLAPARPDGEKRKIVEFLQYATERGMQLPVDTNIALGKDIDDVDVLKVFANASRNKQIIPQELLDALIAMFDPETQMKDHTINVVLINIFKNAAKNNQMLPKHLLDKLEKALMLPRPGSEMRMDNDDNDNESLSSSLLSKLEQSALLVFNYLAQKGEKLSLVVNNKLLDKLASEKDPVLIQELLSSLPALMNANKADLCKLYLPKINGILAREIRSDNANVQSLCVSAVSALVAVIQGVGDSSSRMMNVKQQQQRVVMIDETLLEALVETCTDSSSRCSPSVALGIRALFDSIDDSHNPCIAQRQYREKMQLATLKSDSPRNLLAQLRCYVNLSTGFLAQNYKQLKHVIDNAGEELQEAALTLLLGCKCKSALTDELLDSVAILCESTREFGMSNQDVSDLLKSIRVSCSSKDEILGIQTLEDLLQMILKQKPDSFFLVESFVHLVEQCLLKRRLLHMTLPCYCRIIKEKKCRKVEECLEQSLLVVQQQQQQEQSLIIQDEHQVGLKTWLFLCMYYASKLIIAPLPSVCMDVVVDSLDSDDELIRWTAYGILRASSTKDKKYATIVNNWNDLLLTSVTESCAADVTLDAKSNHKGYTIPDLLEIIVSLKFPDLDVFAKNEKDVWKRELLASSIFAKFRVVNKLDQMNFYANWFRVEETFKYHKSCKVLLLLHNFKFQHGFSQIAELTLMMPDLSFDEVMGLLNTHSPDPYTAFKQEWCVRKIQASGHHHHHHRNASTSSDDSNKKQRRGGISVQYSQRLAQKLCSAFHAEFISKLFASLKSIDNLCAFENLIDFCLREKINPSDALLMLDGVNNEGVQLMHLMRLVEAKQLMTRCAKCRPETKAEEKQFLRLFQILCDAGWDFVQMRDLVAAFEPSSSGAAGAGFNRFRNLLHFLNTIQTYGLFSASNFIRCKEILKDNTSFRTMMQKLNKLAIENHFQLEGKQKDLNELVAELKKSNKHDQALLQFINRGALDIRKHVFEDHSAELLWNEKQIYLWALDVKHGIIPEFSDYKGVAVILRANFLISGHTLTDTQILCSLIALRTTNSSGSSQQHHLNNKGKLLEVATGEGKSTIICILAIINALRGNPVDVITSSPVLAERDAKQKAKLYRMFGLTCSDNNDKTVYLRGKKTCYAADIVYGEMSQFQFDILRDTYSQLGTLNGREFTTAIIDEVDSMLIDDSSKIARLSSTISGMDHFQAMYVLIWQRLVSIRERFIMFHGKLYFVDGKVGFEKGKMTLDVVDGSSSNDGSIWKIPDLEKYLIQFGDNDESRVSEYVGDDVDEYLRKSLGSYLDEQIKVNKIYIPSNFAEFLQKQKPKWIANAVEALNYQENVHYYKHVYGLTGTLGSETARAVLQRVYQVDLINIPQRRQKQYLELESIIAESEAAWLKAIESHIIHEIQKDRGILVICETIENTSRIRELLLTKNKLPPNALKVYAMNDVNQEKNVEKILPGEVIIATNLAGRGTDIQTDEIETTGGLHVILTFMPGNQRVEDQAFGRTARQGKRGTGLMILNAQQLPMMNMMTTTTTMMSSSQHETNDEITTSTTRNIKAERDTFESQQLKTFQEVDLKPIQVKDELFDVFCAFLNGRIRASIKEEEGTLGSKFKSFFYDQPPTMYESTVLAAVEEQWAGFLRKLDEKVIQCRDAKSECDKLIARLWQDFEAKNVIKNPYHYICIANDILSDKSASVEEVERAMSYFKKAVDLEQMMSTKTTTSSSKDDPESHSSSSMSYNCPGAAYVGIGWCEIRLKDKQKEGYKDRALSAFKSALTCLSNEMAVLSATQLLLEQKQTGFLSSDLYKQLNIKATILGSYLSSVNDSMNAVKRSKRLIDVVSVHKHKDGAAVMETIKYFNEQERLETDLSTFKNNKDLKVSDKERYSLIFNHLTRREDSGTIDQALNTLNNAFDANSNVFQKAGEAVSRLVGLRNAAKAKMFGSSEYSCLLDHDEDDESPPRNNIRINLKDVDMTQVHSCIFNPDKEFTDLTGESAEAKLKEERSYWHALRVGNSFKVNLTMHSVNNNNNNSDNNNTNQHEKSKAIKQTFSDKEINEAISIVKEEMQKDIPRSKDLRFDMVIKEANVNALNEELVHSKGSDPDVTLNVEFGNLNQAEAMLKLSSIKARSLDIEFVANKSNKELLNLVQRNEALKSAKVYVSKTSTFEKVTRKELVNRFKNLETDTSPLFVKFEALTSGVGQTSRDIVNSSCGQQGNVMFGIAFHGVQDYYNNTGLRDAGGHRVNLSFDKLNRKSAEMVINTLRKENLEFSLEFKDLSHKEVKFILKQASLEQEDMEIRKVKNVCDLFMKAAYPTVEINEFESKGIQFLLEMSEKMFVPWWSVCAVAALGACQIIVGGVLIASGFGASMGMGFVTEGLADMMTAYRAYSTRQFHWSDYCKQKAVSLVISAVSAGYSKCKESVQGAAKGMETFVTGVGKEALEQAGTQVVSNAKVVGQTLIKTGQNAKSFAAKIIATKTAEAVAREGLNTGVQYLSNFTFDLLKPEISECVQSRVKASFCNTELMGYLRKMYAIDLVTNSRQLQSKVDQIVSDSVNPRHDFMRKQWDSVGLPLLKGVLSDPNKCGSYASMAIRITGTLHGLYQVGTLTDNVVQALVKKLRLMDRNSMTLGLVLHKSLGIKRDAAFLIADGLLKQESRSIFDDSDNFNVSHSDLLASSTDDESNRKEVVQKSIDRLCQDWKKNPDRVLKELGNDNAAPAAADDVEKCIDFVRNLYAKFLEIDLECFSVMMRKVSEEIAGQLIRVMDSQMLQPWTTLMVSNLTAGISKRVQHHLLVDPEQNSESHKADQKKYDELEGKKDLTPEEKAFVANYGRFRTFEEQMKYNAKDYCEAYSQCEMAYYAGQDNDRGRRDDGTSAPPDPNVKKAADGVRGDAPANLATTLAMAKANGVNLKVVDDENYQRTPEEIENGVQVMYVKPGANSDDVGHAYYMDNDGVFREIPSAGNDCAFAAFSMILEQSKGISKSVEDLRAETADRMESNSASFGKVLSAENWIRTTNPESANRSLFAAGLYRDADGKLVVERKDALALANAVKMKLQSRGRQFAKPFKDAVDRPDPATETTLHHIIPNQDIEQAVKDLDPRPQGDTTAPADDSVMEPLREAVEKYMNKDHIKPIVEKQLDEEGQFKNPNRVGTFLHASYSNNPHNLVGGPDSQLRGKNDPGSAHDTEIGKLQTHEHQQAVDNFYKAPAQERLDKFADLPPTRPVQFEIPPGGQEYVAKERNQERKTRGFRVKAQLCENLINSRVVHFRCDALQLGDPASGHPQYLIEINCVECVRSGTRTVRTLRRGIMTTTTTTTTTANFEAGIKAGLANGTCSPLDVAPRVLSAEATQPGGVYVHKDGLQMDVAAWFRDPNWGRDRVLLPTLKASSYGEYELSVGLMSTDYFESRHQLDSLCSKELLGDDDGVEPSSSSCPALAAKSSPDDVFGKTVDRISFRDALKLVTVDIRCNMDYFLAHRDEMAKALLGGGDNEAAAAESPDAAAADLKMTMMVESTDADSTNKRLEDRLFYRESLKIFGRIKDEGDDDDDNDEKSAAVTFTDFRRLFFDGNERCATAQHGKNYVIIYYVTG
ncbi:unnamed protein product [Notodromas monacha]|uniref:Uncharacterized protein n=1 Tax=Notodromas monacha TaxID=399045 RepID=A0A7R9BFX8_9CRUS|nr:unnamed protein product [Notodromas monacha]CAG0914726.1 unnamed protein product [Notodromas monacha]